MSGCITNYAGNCVLDSLFRGRSFPVQSEVYLGLSYTTANKAGFIQEPDAPCYRRILIEDPDEVFKPPESGATYNLNSLIFPPPTEDWGNVLSLFSVDAPEGGNVLAMTDLIKPMKTKIGESFVVRPRNLGVVFT